jgi:hypothetical protein
MSNIVKRESTELAASTTVFAGYLRTLGLPTDNIIATTDEREIVATNLPAFLASLSPEEKRDARYLAKFVGATAVGLFDAALNYVWNEVVLNLRRKAVVYGVDLFFDSAVGGKSRELYKDEDDLAGLKDAVLLETCRKLELISDVVYRKLDHILTMRNEVAASHPNVASIGGFELLGWLQTCVKDVLQDRPSESAIRIKALVDNLRARTDVIDEQTRLRFRAELRNLSTPHVQNLLITVFGMYVDPSTNQVLRKNISLIARDVWECAPEQFRYYLGVKIDGYRTNLQQDRLGRGIEFLTMVGGRRYESLPARLIALEELTNRLYAAHVGYDNFYHEPTVMSDISGYCARSSDIPEPILPRLVQVVVQCRLGRGLSYREGVSPGARSMYDQFLGVLDEKGIVCAIVALSAPEINSKLDNAICQGHLAAVLSTLECVVVSDRLREVITYLKAEISKIRRRLVSREFRELMAPFLRV